MLVAVAVNVLVAVGVGVAVADVGVGVTTRFSSPKVMFTSLCMGPATTGSAGGSDRPL